MHLFVSPLGAMLRAKEFAEASRYLQSRTERFSPVAGFLACRAIELSLKAFLRSRGEQFETTRRRFGHRLGPLLVSAREHGLDHFLVLSQDEGEFLVRIGEEYAAHNWAYFDLEWAISTHYSPEPEELGQLVSKFVHTFEPIMRGLANAGGDMLELPTSE